MNRKEISIEKNNLNNNKFQKKDKEQYHKYLKTKDNNKNIINKISKYFLPTKIIIALFIISSIFIYYKVKIKFITLQNIVNNKENFTTTTNIIKFGKKFFDLCLQGKLMTDKIFKQIQNPKITMIIPLYNTGERTKLIVRSIQNQNMEDIEIILVNDFSKDNTLQITQKLKEKDPRIQIINNEKNMGTLYSRSIGVLYSKGEYITNLDHDDFLFDKDIFDIAYKAAKDPDGDFDIISFMHVSAKSYYSKTKEIRGCTIRLPHNFRVFQPELSTFMQFGENGFRYFDYRIWAKLFKNEVYKNATNILGSQRFSHFVTFTEDLIGLFVIANVAKSYKFIRKYGVFHLDDDFSASNIATQESRIFSDILFSDVIFE